MAITTEGLVIETIDCIKQLTASLEELCRMKPKIKSDNRMVKINAIISLLDVDTIRHNVLLSTIYKHTAPHLKDIDAHNPVVIHSLIVDDSSLGEVIGFIQSYWDDITVFDPSTRLGILGMARRDMQEHHTRNV
jgi:hypothetical protein